MLVHTKHIDTSTELLFQRCYNGMKLIRPEKNISPTVPTVAEIFNLSCNIYFVNADNVIENYNNEVTRVCGLESGKHPARKSLAKLANFSKECMQTIINNNNQVMRTNTVSIIEEAWSVRILTI